jgi:hypothetical protein
MPNLKCFLHILLLIGILPQGAAASEEGLAAWWRFDEGQGKVAVDHINSVEDEIRGLAKYVTGVSGTAIKFDGFSSSVVRKASSFPKLNTAFSIEAWIALGAYPWNWVPIVSQNHENIIGFFFGLDSRGNLGFHISDGSSIWHECNSRPAEGQLLGMELKKWHHVMGTYDPDSGLAIYINGEIAGSVELKKKPVFALEVDLLIGRNHKPLPPTDPVRAWATYPSWYSFDGIIDEIKIYNRALSIEEVKTAFHAIEPETAPDLAPRRFPSVEKPSGRFGANYTKLKYYEEWDNIWPVGDSSDIVVQFDELSINVMFWRGSRYSPCWVSENGKWMADQSRETGYNWFLRNGPREILPTGCLEHMSDTQCRSSRVSIIENNDARILVHWRYLQMDVQFRQKDLQNQTGFGEWADEYYTIYPDGVAVRKLGPGRGGWQETIFFSEPGTRPEDNCELGAITLVNNLGEGRTYSWEHGYPVFDLENPIIQMTNLKSKFKPYMILRPGARWRVFNGEVRPEYSRFPWWNHWPVAQVSSDGRYASASDRAAHSSLCWGGPRDGVALYGMTDKPAVSLVSLARSWNNPPKIHIAGNSVKNEGYDPSQRAYVLRCNKTGSSLNIEIGGSEESPVVNPALVIKNWGSHAPQLKIDGQSITRGKEFRWGIEYTISGQADLIVWIKKQSQSSIKISLDPS